MNVKIQLVVLFFLCAISNLYAQPGDSGIWIDFAATKEIKKARFSLDCEFYTKDNSRKIDRNSIGLEGNYPITSLILVNAGYLLMNYDMTDYHEIRNRFFSAVKIEWHLSEFVFNHRERIQLTRKPLPGDNIRNDLYWRNRFRVDYKKPAWKINPSATIETFYSFGKSGTKSIDEMRYSLAAVYHLTHKQEMRVYCLISVTTVKKFYVFGLDYQISI